MTSPPPSQEAPPPSTLSTLQAFLRAQHNRTALSAEIESALTSFLTNNPTPLLDTAVVGSCSAEVVRPPNEIELGEVLKIGFKGLMEVKDEVEDLEAILRVVCKRDDLANLLKKVEALENDRLREVGIFPSKGADLASQVLTDCILCRPFNEISFEDLQCLIPTKTLIEQSQMPMQSKSQAHAFVSSSLSPVHRQTPDIGNPN